MVGCMAASFGRRGVLFLDRDGEVILKDASGAEAIARGVDGDLGVAVVGGGGNYEVIGAIIVFMDVQVGVGVAKRCIISAGNAKNAGVD